MKSNTIWIAVACGLVGFLVGEHMPRKGGSDDSQDKPSAKVAAGDKGGPTEIPKDWITEDALGAKDDFAGLSPRQRFLALKVLNEKPCDCGCPHGSVAKCKKDDPGCPRAPTIIKQAALAAKENKDFDGIMAAVKKPDAPAPGAEPTPGPQKIELAAWTPIEGPKLAKVTIVEFSDFQ